MSHSNEQTDLTEANHSNCRAVEVAFKKTRFFRFFKKTLKNPKVQNLGF